MKKPECPARKSGDEGLKWLFLKKKHPAAARGFFTVAGSQMVLLHAFIKKSRKTPQPDLEIAKARKSHL